MTQLLFPPLVLNEWKETRDTLQKYCRMVGAIREAMSNLLPHSFHTNLLVSDRGFTTSLLPKNTSSVESSFEVVLDLKQKRLVIESNFREPMRIALTGQSLNALCDETCSLMVDVGIVPPLERPSFLEGSRGRFDSEPLLNYWKAVTSVYEIMIKTKAVLREGASLVQLRPDDLALILIWFGNDYNVKNDFEEQQVEFGFSTGDEVVPDAYFYVSTFPDNEEIEKLYSKEYLILNNGKSFRAVLPYGLVRENRDAEKIITHFFKGAGIFFQEEKE